MPTIEDQDNTRGPLKAMLWEEAKGKLRALLAVQGSYRSLTSTNSPADTTPEWTRYAALEEQVESFIRTVEDNGLHE